MSEPPVGTKPAPSWSSPVMSTDHGLHQPQGQRNQAGAARRAKVRVCLPSLHRRPTSGEMGSFSFPSRWPRPSHHQFCLTRMSGPTISLLPRPALAPRAAAGACREQAAPQSRRGGGEVCKRDVCLAPCTVTRLRSPKPDDKLLWPSGTRLDNLLANCN